MADENDDYIYDEVTGEWRPASEMGAVAETGPVAALDAAGNVLADGDSVVPDQGPQGEGRQPDPEAGNRDQVDPPR